jgi:two-component system NtrC family sensor kinase
MPASRLLSEESQPVDILTFPLYAERMRAGIRFLAELTAVDAGLPGVQVWILEEIGRILKTKSTTLYLVDKVNDQSLIKKAKGEGGRWTSLLVPLDEEGLVVEAMRIGDQIIKKGPAGENLFCIPLMTDDEALGAIEVLSEQDLFVPELLAAIGESIAQNLYQSRKAQQSQETIDSLQTFQEQLLNSRNTLRALFDSSPTSIYIVDPAYKLIAINMNRADVAERSPKSLVGKLCFTALFQREAPCPGCLVGKTLQTGINTRRTERRWISEESSIELEVSTFPIWDQERQIVQVFLFEEDVTERQQLQASLAQSEKLAAVGQLAAGVAHEINNPLTTILANAQLLQRKLPSQDKDLQEMVGLIIQASDRASQAVRDLLDFARRERYDLTPTDINETIQRTLSLMGHEMGSRSISLRFDPAPDLPAVMASVDHLQGVWLNLLINAIDAIDPGPGTIHIITGRVDDTIQVSVIDNGIGIPPERISRIFEPFYTTKDPGRGTGLGLSVCHQIVTRHGGQILVSSQPDEGTTITVNLPLS